MVRTSDLRLDLSEGSGCEIDGDRKSGFAQMKGVRTIRLPVLTSQKMAFTFERRTPGKIAIGKDFVHKPLKAPKKGEQRTGFSAMFWLNHVCARIRADLARMGRSSWCFSRSMDSLQSHLDMFIEFCNNRQYRIAS